MFALKRMWDFRRKFDVNLSDLYVTCHAHYYLGSRILNNKIIVNKNCHSFSKLHMLEDDVRYYLNYISDLKPKWFLLQPSVAYTLGSYIREYDINLPSLKYIELTGEMLTNPICNTLKEMFPNVSILNNYGMQEFYCIGYGENSINRLKVLEDNVYVEVVDDNNQILENGVDGNIVVTGLINSFFPLVRYRTGDKGRISRYNDGLYIEITESRSNDLFVYNDKCYDASMFFNIVEQLNQKNCNINQFQFTYEKNELWCEFFSSQSELSEDQIGQFVNNYLREKFDIRLHKIHINWNKDFFVGYDSNKRKYFINKDN